MNFIQAWVSHRPLLHGHSTPILRSLSVARSRKGIARSNIFRYCFVVLQGFFAYFIPRKASLRCCRGGNTCKWVTSKHQNRTMLQAVRLPVQHLRPFPNSKHFFVNRTYLTPRCSAFWPMIGLQAFNTVAANAAAAGASLRTRPPVFSLGQHTECE